MKKEYIITQDTPAVLRTIGQFDGNPTLRNAADAYFNQITQILSQVFEGTDITLRPFTEVEVESRLENAVLGEIQPDPDVLCVCLDRFLLRDIEINFPSQFERLSITRTEAGEKMARPGQPPIEVQILELAEKAKDRPLIIVDDGVFTGGTVGFVIESLVAAGIDPAQINKVIGFVGNGRTSLKDRPLEILKNSPALYEWIDVRDFGPFGGKTQKASRNGRITTASPYIFPWTDGASASLDKLGSFLEISKGMVQAAIELTSSYEAATQSQITIKDLVKAGFPIPVDQAQRLFVGLNTPLVEYLNVCLEKINQEAAREVVIFDMDGTLYQLDGENKGYKGSTLEKAVVDKATAYIMAQEGCSQQEADELVNQGLNDPVGLSSFLGQRYGISRKQYFDVVWDINPEGIVINYQEAAETVKSLMETGKKLILLTSAPQVWQQQVVKFLGLDGCFETVYTAEDFKQKGEIFERLSQRYQPQNMTSVGDQQKTDIEPAAQYGLKTMLVSDPSQVRALTSEGAQYGEFSY